MEAEKEPTYRDFIDAFATIWREIGQPSTDGLFVAVAVFSEVHALLQESGGDTTILGMPVIYADTYVGVNEIGICSTDPYSRVPDLFSKAIGIGWKCYIEKK